MYERPIRPSAVHPTARALVRGFLMVAVALGALTATHRPAAAESRHVVFDLVANSGLSHLLRGGGVVVDAGSWAFPRYANGNIARERWSIGVPDGTATVALSDKRQSWLFIPLGADEAKRVKRLRMHVQPGAKGASLTVKLNGKELPARPMQSGWQTVSWDLPAGRVVAGENELALDFGNVGKVAGRKAAGGIAWLSFDDGAGGADDAPDLALDAADGSLRLVGGGGLAWYVFVPEGAALDLSMAGSGPPCSVDVAVRGPKAAATEQVSLPAGGAALSKTIDLAAVQGDVARLSLEVAPGCREVTLRAGGLALPGPAPAFTRAGPAPKRIVLYLIDTLRADRLKVYNPKTRVKTPALDRLAAEGTVFLQNYSQGNESYVSHAAIFTGQYPMTNGVYTGERKLRADHYLISEAIKKAGLRTAGFTSNGYIDVRNGYLQGWTTYVNALIQKKPYKAPGLLKQAREWVEGQGDVPWFLYVGPVDPHVSYRAHEGIIDLYDPSPYRGRYTKTCSGDDLGKIKGSADRVAARDRVRIEALYDNEVDFSDRHLALFLEFLEKRGQLDDTMIVVTSDHGDEFWEHGDVGHGHSLYEELVHVPLIVRYPPLFPAGARIAEGVDTIDIYPTLLDALGKARSKGLQGMSLLPLANGEGGGYPMPSVATRNGRLYAVRLGRYKMIVKRLGERRLYDLASDPTEQKDVIGGHAIAARYVADAAGLFIHYEKQWDKATWGVPSNLKGVPSL